MHSQTAINWLDNTSRSIRGQMPSSASCSESITLTLSRLLLERLPVELGLRLISLLPEEKRDSFPEHALRAKGSREPSALQYRDLVRMATNAIRESCPEIAESDSADAGQRLASIFLWEVAHEIPPDLKSLFAQALPVEIGSRMNLFASGGSEDAKVA